MSSLARNSNVLTFILLAAALSATAVNAQLPITNDPPLYGPWNGTFFPDGDGLRQRMVKDDSVLRADSPWSMYCWVRVEEAPKAFTLLAGGAMATQYGVALDLTPDRDYLTLQRAARAAVADVFGEEAARYDGGRPHLPIAYGAGAGDSGLVQGRLRNATDRRVTLSVTDARLVDVTRDVAKRELSWRELAAIPLGPAR